MDKINLNKQVYNKNQYEKVIDTKFSQLNAPIIEAQQASSISIEQFFQYYEQLFYQIPKNGELNSHEYLIKTSSEYIDYQQSNEDIQALIDEITSLRQQNLEINQELVKIQTGQTSSIA